MKKQLIYTYIFVALCNIFTGKWFDFAPCMYVFTEYCLETVMSTKLENVMFYSPHFFLHSTLYMHWFKVIFSEYQNYIQFVDLPLNCKRSNDKQYIYIYI